MNTVQAHQAPYLHDIPLEEAQRTWEEKLRAAGALPLMPGERVPLSEAVGRVTAAPVWARLSEPHYHAAAMDGYAVRAEDTIGATETSPKRLRIGTQAIYVDTGDPLPSGMNAVIMLEEVHLIREGGEAGSPTHIEILRSVPPWQHVRLMGEDIVVSQLVIPTNHCLRPQDIGAIAGAGHESVIVRRRPRVAILPTGTELVPPGAPVQPGDIIEFNSLVLAGLVEECGGIATRLEPVPDNFDHIRKAVEAALADHDMVIINAGSSAGSEDYTAKVVATLGEVFVHGVAIRPGHPIVLGVAQGKPVLGAPGFPVAAVLSFELFARPVLFWMLGLEPPQRPTLNAVMTRKVLSPLGQDEFLRVSLGRVGDRVVATPLQRGASVIMSLVQADGIVRIPRFSEGVHAGETVQVELMVPSAVIDRTVVMTGSHDLTIDLLRDILQRERAGIRLISTNVGSLSGLLALQRGEAHIAGAHLLDEATGEYNVPYIQRLLPDQEVVVLGFVYREQGLMVLPGNPKGITRLEDLTRPDVTFVNRQRGAGTRVLLDYALKEQGIHPRQIRGYERVEYTHLAVAAAVKGGAADVGLGILAAARALGLDFVPLFKERYDLVIPKRFFESDLLAPLLAVLRSDRFQEAVTALGGYDVSPMGQVIAIVRGEEVVYPTSQASISNVG